MALDLFVAPGARLSGIRLGPAALAAALVLLAGLTYLERAGRAGDP